MKKWEEEFDEKFGGTDMPMYIAEDDVKQFISQLLEKEKMSLLDEIMEEIDKTSQLITIFRGFSEKSERIIYQSDMKNLIKSKY